MKISVESKIRAPVSGERVKLRAHLKYLGITVKFRTEILRDGRFLVVSKIPISADIKEFNGRAVVFTVSE